MSSAVGLDYLDFCIIEDLSLKEEERRSLEQSVIAVETGYFTTIFSHKDVLSAPLPEVVRQSVFVRLKQQLL